MVGGDKYRSRGPKHDEPPLDSQWTKNMKQKLQEFYNGHEQALRLDPGMERHERRWVHTQAFKMGLISKSTGNGMYRQCVITRRPPVSIASAAQCNDTDPVELTPEQAAIINSYIVQYPIYDEDIDDHVQVTVEGRNSLLNQNKNYSGPRAVPQIPPPGRPSPDVAKLRMELPAFKSRYHVIETIEANKVTLVTGGTGCGKTTQVPQFLLERSLETKRPLRVICTQPRRLPAIAVAERVSRERGEKVGMTVGYHIRLEQRVSSQTVLTYCTSGVLLRMLTQDELASDCTHVILDEIHEREQNTDYLLIALKQALKKRNDLKVILMSATMEGNLHMFLNYFKDSNISHVDIPSRLFPVEKFTLADVIALTGYAPPESTFGGYFNSFSSGGFTTGTGFGSNGGFGGGSKYNTGYRIDNWNSESEVKRANEGNVASSKMVKPNDAFSSASNWTNDMKPCSPAVSSTEQSNVRSIGGSTSAMHNEQLMNVAHQLAHANITRQESGGQKNDNYQGGRWKGTNDWPSEQRTISGCTDVVDLPPDEEDIQMTAASYYQHHQQPNQPNQFGGGSSQASQSYNRNGQSCAPQGSFNQFQQGMYQYQQYQSQPNMQQHIVQQNWQGQQMSGGVNESQQPMFYVPTDGQPSGDGSFYRQGAQPSSNAFQNGGASTIHRSTSAAASLSDADQYGLRIREEESNAAQMRQRLTSAIVKRPTVFSDEALIALRNTRLDRETIVNMYKSCGGQQWAEAVDIELALKTVKYLVDSPIGGAILVFLPGYEDMQALRDKIQLDVWNGLRPSVCLLHSQLNTAEQQRVFDPTRPGERKVILSTNIAEASLTIDDVVFVIDSGKAKEKTYDHFSRISQLKVVWIAKSNAEQRSGRAGRCRPGFCFRLYSDEDYNNMLQTQVAEMQRSAIHDVCLHAKMFAPEKMSVKDFLQLAPEPPEKDAIDNSLQFLEQLGALYSEVPRPPDFFSLKGRASVKEPELTHLGRLLAHLPLDPQLSRLLLFGYTLRCFSPIVTLVALLSHRDPFTLAMGDEKMAALSARDSFAHRDFSDHLMMLRAFNAFSLCPNYHYKQAQFCREKYLSLTTMKMVFGIRRQLLLELRRIRFVNDVDRALEDPFLNEYSNKWPMVQAAIVAGCHPCLGFVKNSKLRKIRTSTENVAQLHPSSSLRRQTQPSDRRGADQQKFYGPGEPTIEYLAFQEHVKIDEGLTIRTCTAVPGVTIVLMAGPIRLPKDRLGQYAIAGDAELEEVPAGGFENEYRPKDILELETWLTVRGYVADLSRLMQLRFKIMEYFLSVLKDPQSINAEPNRDLLSTLSRVLQIEHKTKQFNEVTDMGRGFTPAQLHNGYEFAMATPSSSGAGGMGVKKETPTLVQPYTAPITRHGQTSTVGERQEEKGEKDGGNRERQCNDVRQQQMEGTWRQQPSSLLPQLARQSKYPDPYRDGNVQRQEMDKKREREDWRRDEREGEYTDRRNKGYDESNGRDERERRDDRGIFRFNDPQRSSGRDESWRRREETREDEQVPEDPKVYENGGRNKYGGGGQRRNYDDRRRNQGTTSTSRYKNEGGGNYQNTRGRKDEKEENEKKQPEVEEEEDWGKNANFPSFFSKEGSNSSRKKTTTFVNSTFKQSGRYQFGGMHSDKPGFKNGSARGAGNNYRKE